VTIRSNDVVSDSKAANDLRRAVRPEAPLRSGAPLEHFSRASPSQASVKPPPNAVVPDGVEHRHHGRMMRLNPEPTSRHHAEGIPTVPEVPEALHAHPKGYQLWLAAVLGGLIALGLAAIHTHPQSMLRARSAPPGASLLMADHRGAPVSFAPSAARRPLLPEAQRRQVHQHQTAPLASAAADTPHR
jgi:hypothetical protein